MASVISAILAVDVVAGTGAGKSGGAFMETFRVATSAPSNRNLEFVVRVPSGTRSPVSLRSSSKRGARSVGIIVLFGGRNWKGADTIKRYGFADFADEHGLFLLSPSFKDDEYWRPEKWSGAALLEALRKIRKRYGLPETRILMYGYSAGGQCAALFHHWRPELVAAWGAHACGVYEFWSENDAKRLSKAPFLITCGEEDRERYHISLRFIQNVRTLGAVSVWKSYPGAGHELTSEVLKLAKAFFASTLRSAARPAFVGDDQAGRLFKAEGGLANEIDPEERSVFFDRATADLWKTVPPR